MPHAWAEQDRVTGRQLLAAGQRLVHADAADDERDLHEAVRVQRLHPMVPVVPGVGERVGSLGLNLSAGGSVFAAFVIATMPMFVLVGFTMRYFVAGLTEGALKL